MLHYIAIIHKDRESSYGVSFPDVPGVITAADSLDDAMDKASEALAFAAEDWESLTGSRFPAPRSLDALRADPQLRSDFANAVVAAIPFNPAALRPAAE
jgi:antitoxin HicB